MDVRQYRESIFKSGTNSMKNLRQIIYWQERKDVFCLRDAKTRHDWNKVRKLLILKVNLTFLIFKGVKLSRPLKLSQRALLLKAREFLYFWCHFAHSWYNLYSVTIKFHTNIIMLKKIYGWWKRRTNTT